MSAEYRKIGPTEAAELLATNEGNRRVASTWVAKLTRDMQEGRFADVADPIRLDLNGKLLDGQHRLTAIVQSGVTLRLLVVDGLDRGARRFMDKGRKRTVGDDLHMDFGLPNAATVVAIVRFVIRWQENSLKNSARYRPTDSEVYENAVQYADELVESARYAMNTRTSISAQPTAIGTLHFITTQHQPAIAYPFWKDVDHGADLHEGDPALTLRNAIIRTSGQARYGDGPELHAAMYTKAWNARYRRRVMKRLSLQPADKITEDDYQLKGVPWWDR